MPRTKPPYPPEFKWEAVRLVKEGSHKISDVARELGVTGESIRTWIRQHEIDNGQREGLGTSEREELQRLRRETRFLKEERDILKKATITQHYTSEGWLYLAVIIDLFSRIIAGWSMSDRPVTDLVTGALNMAVWNRRPDKGLIHHSDHGAQYTSLVFSQRLQDTGLLGSMGTVGDALDNAAAESFYATLQTELLDRNNWPTRSLLRSAIFEYIEVFYNRRRRHSSLEYLSPAEFEARWFNQTKLKVSA